MGLEEIMPAGVITGKNVLKLFEYCKNNGHALPAFNCTSTSTINCVLEEARNLNSPVIIQFSHTGSLFLAGKGIENINEKASILGAIAGAQHVRLMAQHYGVPVILHTDHCSKQLLPWFEGLLEADEKYFEVNGEPLFSSHTLDLSGEYDEDNIATCEKYFKRMVELNLWLEMEIGITGKEAEAITASKSEVLYTKPEQVYNVYKALSVISPMFSIATAFGNVHGVYKPGNVVVSPHLLGDHQQYIREMVKCEKKPLFLVMHGGSGCTADEIKVAVDNGIVKMNVDTDTQWAYWYGVKELYTSKEDYFQTQVGNPEGDDKPNKKYFDPRVWIRAAEESMMKKARESFKKLNCVNVCGDNWPKVCPKFCLRSNMRRHSWV